MNKCENCIHNAVCDMGSRFVEAFVDNNGICTDYKDKSLIVELPCKVGDIVYEVCDVESVHRQILEMEVLTIELSSDKGVVHLKTIKKYRYNYGSVTFDDFGKTVFLSREEAERALAEKA